MSKIILRNREGVVLKGKFIRQESIGGSDIVTLNLDGTTTTITADLADFDFVNIVDGSKFALDKDDLDVYYHDGDRREAPLRGMVYHKISSEPGYDDGYDVVDAIEEADVISSLVVPKGDDGPKFPRHKVVLDIDFPAKLIPSSTPQHYHLYIDKEMSERAYFNLVSAFVQAGIVEPGYLGASERRGYTSARLPWIKKETADAPF